MPPSADMTNHTGVIKLPDIASVLKDEIARLARKELRRETAALKKAVATYRTEIAALKRRIAALEKAAGRTDLRAAGRYVARVAGDQAGAETGEGGKRHRFSAKRLKVMRERMGLSGPDFAALVGVSPQTIYNWEAETTRPREAQLAAIAAVRGLGKREVARRLEALSARAEARVAEAA